MLVRRLTSLLLLVLACNANAADPTIWSLQQEIFLNDTTVLWTAPSAIDTSIARHDFDYQITSVGIFYGGRTQIDDETNRYLAANSLSGAGALIGAPGTLWSQTLDEPINDTQFDLTAVVGSDGIGRVTFDNISLGTVPDGFSGDRIPITSLVLEATITLTESDIVPGDYSGNGVVNQTDYFLWLEDYGLTSSAAATDGNGDGVVNAADYVIWRDNLTTSSAVSVPEPTAVCLLALAGLLAGGRRLG